MAERVVKSKDRHHTLTVRGASAELIVIGFGKRNSYLWIGRPQDYRGADPNAVMTISGTKTLRAIAKAILKQVGTR